MASARYDVLISEEDLVQTQYKELTPQEKRANFIHYHKWHFVAIVAVLALVISMLYTVLSKVDPDYHIAVLGYNSIHNDALTALEEQLEAIADDRNGDGIIEVVVSQYCFIGSTDGDSSDYDYETQMAGSTQFVSDVTTGDSMIFLVNNVESYNSADPLFLDNDFEYLDSPDYDNVGYAWTDCPFLANLELGTVSDIYTTSVEIEAQKYFTDYTVIMRAAYGTSVESDDDLLEYFEACKEFFLLITEGAS